MKILHIIETTETNIKLLQQLTDIVISHFPDVIEKDSEFYIEGYKMVNDVKPILKQYIDTKYKNGIIKFVSTDFHISNLVGDDFKSFGYFSASDEKIGINIAGIVRNSIPVSKENIMRMKKVRSTLIHEIRHLFQYSEYPEFFKKDSILDINPTDTEEEIKAKKSEAYRKRKIEIDAVFHHLLVEYEPKNHSSASKYVKIIMDELLYYKALTSKQIEHYKRKIIQYYINATENHEKENWYDMFTQETFDSKEYTNIREYVNDVLINYFGDDFNIKTATSQQRKIYFPLRQYAIDYYKQHQGK